MDLRGNLLKSGKKNRDVTQELSSSLLFDQERSRQELTSAIILHEYPLSIVDHIGFRRFVNSLQPAFKMVSRNTIRNDILKTYDLERAKAYQLIGKVRSRIAITTDMWTSKNSKRGYMAVTAHFIDDSWILQSCILRFVYVPAPHTADALGKILVKSFLEWNIDRKLSTITVDNCSTNDAMLVDVLSKLSRKDLILDGTLLHLRCCAHILNLIVKDGLTVISEEIETIRESVVFWSASPSRVEKFEDAARQLNIDCTKKLSLDCKTRWNSTYLMLETALIYREVFSRVKQQDKHYKNVPTDEDWENAKEICHKLKVFFHVTRLFSGTLYPTSNLYFPKICEVKMHLNEWVQCPSIKIQEMAKKMLNKYEKYWESCHLIMSIAAVLDPMYKMKIVEFYFPIIYSDPIDADLKIEQVRESCYMMLAEYKSKALVLDKSSSNIISETINHGSSSSSSHAFGATTEMDPLSKFDLFVASNVSSTSVRSELDIYLEECVLPRTPIFDVLSWWKTNGVKYPNLQKMAKDILAIPVSTVASESAFSTSGRLIGPHRSRLHPETLEALMCTRSWLSKEFIIGDDLTGLDALATILEEEEDTTSVIELTEL